MEKLTLHGSVEQVKGMSGYVEGLGWPEKFYFLTWVVVSKSIRLMFCVWFLLSVVL